MLVGVLAMVWKCYTAPVMPKTVHEYSTICIVFVAFDNVKIEAEPEEISLLLF
jgi:hypothetical protein